MSGSAAIEARGLGKRYRLGAQPPVYETLRDVISTSVARRPRATETAKDLWALRDVDLTVREGQAFGLVGSNGAGKTTLLRVLARITRPTTGLTRTRGRVGTLLEVGTGFHPELTGRDNVFLSGAVMGMSRRDTRRRFDQIVQFAGVERFIDTPLKRYSTGMQLRLAFAIGAHLEPEVMLVDEVLAVGDFDFQRRCLQRMSQLREEGRTVVFVSHDLGAITRLCSDAAWIHDGRIVEEGPAAEVVEAYLGSALRRVGRVELPVDGPAGVRSVALVDTSGQEVAQPRRGQPLIVEVRLVVAKPVAGLDLSVIVQTPDGTRLVDEGWSDQDGLPELAPEAGEWTVHLEMPPILRAEEYVLAVWLGTEAETLVERQVLAFQVTPDVGDRHEWQTRRRLVQPAARWRLVT